MVTKIDASLVEKDMLRNGMTNMISTKQRTEVIKGYRKKLEGLLKLPTIPQKSQEWYETRYNLITASDFAQALGEGKFGSQKQLIEKKCEPLNTTDTMAASKSNIFFAWGHMFEPLATAVYSHMNGVHVHDFGLLKHPKYSFFGASPDGISELGVMLEIKCPFKRKITGDIPSQYYYQIQGQLDVCDLDECDYLECEFGKYDTYEEYVAAYETEGVGKYTGQFYEDDEGKFIYGDVSLDKCDMATDQPRTSYWILKTYNLKRVTRDKTFLQEKLHELGKVWGRILEYRKSPERFAMEVKCKISIDTQGLVPQKPKVASVSTTTTKKTGVSAPVEEKKFMFVELEDD